MKHLSRGGKKVNYTLYISPDDKAKIIERAKSLQMTTSYYLMHLVDAEIDLVENGYRDVVPDVTVIDKVVQPSAVQEPVSARPVAQVPSPYATGVPTMKSIDDLKAEIGSGMGGAGQPRTLTHLQNTMGNWQEKIHRDVMTSEQAEKNFRQQILKNLPPEEKKDAT